MVNDISSSYVSLLFLIKQGAVCWINLLLCTYFYLPLLIIMLNADLFRLVFHVVSIEYVYCSQFIP